jgi:hypothetical protein
MPAYILRYTGTKYFAGLYAADNEDQLYFLIDEQADASDYEYAIVRRGLGIEFRSGERNIRYKIGKGHKARVDAFSETDGLYLTEGLCLALDSGKGLVWHRF